MFSEEDMLEMAEDEHIEENNSSLGEEHGKQGMEGEGDTTVEKKQLKSERENPKNTKQITICPMCNGKGYYEEKGKHELAHQKLQERNSEVKLSILPAISQGQKQHYQVEQLFRASDKLSRVSDSAVNTPVTKPLTRLPPVNIPNSSGGKHASAGKVRSSPGNFIQTSDFSIDKKLEKHPEDVARLAAIKLNRNDWETKRAGLEDCLKLARSYQEELEPHMSLVYRTMSSLMNGFHPHITVFVCQAAREFFARMRSICRPEYDELIYSLLARTADTNKYVRLHANDALDIMVTYFPTTHAVRPLVEKGPIHNNPLVRTATARLLTCIVTLKSPNLILTNPYLRETCKKIIETAALLLADSNIDVRAAAKKLISRFMTEEEFESIYYAEVDEKIRKRVHRAFIDIKTKSGSA